MTRIQREFADAQKAFALVELRPTTDGKVYARTALQTTAGHNYVRGVAIAAVRASLRESAGANGRHRSSEKGDASNSHPAREGCLVVRCNTSSFRFSPASSVGP